LPPAEFEPPSKTRRKSEMHALQDLGERLAALKPDQLARITLPEDLAVAIAEYRRFTKWEAKRRQMQYIGRLMRDIDSTQVAAQYDALSRTSRVAVAGFHAAEAWRDRLLAGNDALDAFVTEYPDADRKRIAELADKARSEHAAGRPPASARLLFRELSRLLTAASPAAETAPDA